MPQIKGLKKKKTHRNIANRNLERRFTGFNTHSQRNLVIPRNEESSRETLQRLTIHYIELLVKIPRSSE
jgi:hypothetical protein